MRLVKHKRRICNFLYICCQHKLTKFVIAEVLKNSYDLMFYFSEIKVIQHVSNGIYELLIYLYKLQCSHLLLMLFGWSH